MLGRFLNQEFSQHLQKWSSLAFLEQIPCAEVGEIQLGNNEIRARKISRETFLTEKETKMCEGNLIECSLKMTTEIKKERNLTILNLNL